MGIEVFDIIFIIWIIVFCIISWVGLKMVSAILNYNREINRSKKK